VFGKYKLIKQLGEGATSFVYLVKAPHLEVPVALKVFKNSANALETDFDSFKAEANLLHQLNGQPNIVSLMDVDQLADGRCFIVMPYYASNLSQLLQSANNLSQSTFILIIEQTLTGLAVLHQRGWVHQDIKPANLLLDEHNRVFIADFGIARTSFFERSKNTKKNERIATPEYLCPDLLNDPDKKATPVNDMYSVGVVLSKLFTRVEINDKEFNDAIKNFIAQCLSPNLTNRLSDAHTALTLFQSILKHHHSDMPSDQQTQVINHDEFLSEHAKVFTQMIRGVLINNGEVSKKDKRKLVQSKEFIQLFEEHRQKRLLHSNDSEELLNKLINKVTRELDATHPNWRDLAKSGYQKIRAKPVSVSSERRRRLKVLIWTFFALCLATVLMLVINSVNQSWEKRASKHDENVILKHADTEHGASKDKETGNKKTVDEIFYSQISINTQPKAANVLVFNQDSQVVPLNETRSAFLAQGTYKVRVSLNGFVTLNQEIELSQDQHEFGFELALGDSQYFIANSDPTITDGTPVEFILLPIKSADGRHLRMMSHEVTNELYQRCIDDGACRSLKKLSTDPRQATFERPQHPVINVSWYDINERFVPWLAELTKTALRLPTELEWQAAAAAGSQTRFSWGDSMRRGLAHCRDCNAVNSRHTLPIRQFAPNQWSLFDMLGNVQEWTADCWQASAQTSIRCDQAVVRGGSWLDGKNALQLNARSFLNKTARSHSTGFRLIEEVDTKTALTEAQR
jgi:serine/threonine protein kinase